MKSHALLILAVQYQDHAAGRYLRPCSSSYVCLCRGGGVGVGGTRDVSAKTINTHVFGLWIVFGGGP